jgi:hypothetical protein
LLDKYAETQDKLRSIIVKSRQSGESAVFNKSDRPKKPNTRMSWDFEFRFDGERVCLCRLDGVFIRPTGARHRKKGDLSRTYDGHYYFRLSIGGTRNKAVVRVQEGEELRKVSSKIVTISYAGSEVLGYFWGDEPSEGRRVDSVLRKAKTISVRERMERVGRTKCYVIDAVEKGGNYTLWIDPEHGYNIAKAEVFRVPGQLRARGLTENSSVYSSVRDVRFKKIDSVWVPVEAVTERKSEAFNGTVVWRKVHYKRTEVILNPDHEELRSFYPDDIPSGAEVVVAFVGGAPGRDGDDIEDVGEFTWQPGAEFVVDNNCRVVRNDPDKNLLPIVKALDVGELAKKYQLVPVGPAGKAGRTLLCFWDVDQQQSQQLMRTLGDRQDELAKEGVSIIAIEASGVKTEEAHSWARKNELSFPTGAFYAFFEKTDREKDDLLYLLKARKLRRETISDLKMAWRIDRLPWLILTDHEHIVTAEGFNLEELNARIKDAGQAEVVTNKIAHLASETEKKSRGQLKGELRAVSEK